MFYDDLNTEEQVSYLIKPILQVLQEAGGQLERSEIRDRISELDEHIAEFEQKLYTSNKTGNQYKKFDFKFNFAIKELSYVGLISYVKFNPKITLTQDGANVDLTDFDVKTEVRDKARSYWEEHSTKNKSKNKPVENLLKNPNFEGEFDVNPETKLVSRVEGWDVVIGDRWNSEQQILPEEIDNNQDLDNHVFEIRPYKWAAGWSDGILMQVVDVVPNESYTLSALLKGGIAKKEGKLTGKMIIEEVQDPEKKVITEIASDNWETYSMDYTTSAECNQIRVSFTVGRGGWGNDIGAVRVDNAKLTGTSRTYSPKFGFIDNTADVEYFTIDESGAYAPAQPEITINIED